MDPTAHAEREAYLAGTLVTYGAFDDEDYDGCLEAELAIERYLERTTPEDEAFEAYERGLGLV